MHLALYRRYRPSRFSEITGQNALVSALVRSLSAGQASHAYLFSGPRGCGKTTAARLVAKRLNCSCPLPDGEPCGECPSCVALADGSHMDVVEIDGASNRGIDEIRELKNQVSLAPFSAPFKVFIIDEVHMLTDAAFNALLKTLEEPPARVYFILATTEPHKVPVTIRSRCIHLHFQRISTGDVAVRLTQVCDAEGVTPNQQVLWEIARCCDGSLRDALSLLEQAMGHDLNAKSLEGILGSCGRSSMERWIVDLRQNRKEAFIHLSHIAKDGAALERTAEGLFLLFRDLMLYRLWGDSVVAGMEISEQERDFIASESPNWQADTLRKCASCCAGLITRARNMRADVFGGVLFHELSTAMGSTDEADKPAFIPTQNIQNVVAISQQSVVPGRDVSPAQVNEDYPFYDELQTGGQFYEQQTPRLYEKQTPPPAAQAAPRAVSVPSEADTSSMHPFIGAVFSEDPLAAWAALYVTIKKGAESLEVELPESGYARSVLAQPRAMEIISRAAILVWNMECNMGQSSFQEEPQSRISVSAQPRTSRQAASGGDWVERAKTWLDADLLMVKKSGGVDEQEEVMADE